jgi:hypothetical protein
LKVLPPLYMIGKKVHCWKCGTKMPVISLLAPNVEDTDDSVCILSGIQDLPEQIYLYIQSRVPTFKFKYSKTVKHKYFGNTCPKCGVLFGDFYLSFDLGAPFFPEDENDAKSLYITEIPLENQIEFEASISLGSGEIILENAKIIN